MATIDAPLLAVAERYNRVMERMKKNPSLLTDAGCIKIVSPWFIGPDGQKIQTGTDDAYRQWEEDVESADDEASDPKLETGPAAPSSLLVPFKYNECQRLLDTDHTEQSQPDGIENEESIVQANHIFPEYDNKEQCQCRYDEIRSLFHPERGGIE